MKGQRHHCIADLLRQTGQTSTVQKRSLLNWKTQTTQSHLLLHILPYTSSNVVFSYESWESSNWLCSRRLSTVAAGPPLIGLLGRESIRGWLEIYRWLPEGWRLALSWPRQVEKIDKYGRLRRRCCASEEKAGRRRSPHFDLNLDPDHLSDYSSAWLEAASINDAHAFGCRVSCTSTLVDRPWSACGRDLNTGRSFNELSVVPRRR